MKKSLFVLALATAGLVTAPAFAQDATTATPTAQQGWYVGAQAGYSWINRGPYNDGDETGGIKGGYRFAINPETSIGLEAGYQYLGEIDSRGNGPDAQSKLHGPTLGANLRWNFNPKWYAEVRGGAFYAEGQGLAYNGDSYSKFERTRYYAGVGLGYNVTDHWSVGVNYDYYDGSARGDANGPKLDTNAVTVAGEYRF